MRLQHKREGVKISTHTSDSIRPHWNSFAEGCHTFQWELSSQEIQHKKRDHFYFWITKLEKRTHYQMSVVYRKFDSQKTNIDSKCIKITHAILFPFHIKNHNQSNGHELKEKKIYECLRIKNISSSLLQIDNRLILYNRDLN